MRKGREDSEGLPADRPTVPGKAAQPLCMRAFLETLPFLSERENSLSGSFKPNDYEEQELRQKGILSKSTAPSRFLLYLLVTLYFSTK